jgi:predicted acylesterase/phospholipase RssA
MDKQPRISFVLSSGGARGVFAHTGFLLALKELNIP